MSRLIQKSISFANLKIKHYIFLMFAQRHITNTNYNAAMAAQIIAYFAMKKPENSISVLKVVKLVYLSDRHSMQIFGYPLLTERRVSMRHGPVNSQTLDNINQNNNAIDLNKWSKFVTKKQEKKISSQRDFSKDELNQLSKADFHILDEVWKKFGNMTPSQIRNWTHKNCPEYVEIEFGSSTIELRTMAAKAGLTKEQFYEIENQEDLDIFFQTLNS